MCLKRFFNIQHTLIMKPFTHVAFWLCMVCQTIVHAQSREPINLALNKKVTLSSVTASSRSNYANDGIINNNNYAATEKEEHPFWEIDLGKNSTLKSMKIFQKNLPNTKFKNYRIYISENPFGNKDNPKSINLKGVTVHQVAGEFESGYTFVLCDLSECPKGRFLRLQSEENQPFALEEVEVYGFQEIGGNNIDDDFDGKIDCDDEDLAVPHFTVSYLNPSCPSCNDGNVKVLTNTIESNNLSYSIDGGLNYVPSNIFDKLGSKNYTVFVKNNDGCSAGYEKDITLRENKSAAARESLCNNGDFAQGFDNWTGNWGNGDLKTPVTLNNQGINPLYHEIITGGTDPVSGISLTPLGGGNIAKIGGEVSDDYSMTDLQYCFVPDNSNSRFSFKYAFVLEDGFHELGLNPYFQYSLTCGGKTIRSSRTIADTRNPLLLSDGRHNYTDWITECVDLSECVGQEVCISFTVRDCLQGGHIAYAYVGGVCLAPEDITPVILWAKAKSSFCEYESPYVSVAGSTNGTSYQWTVCELNAQLQEINCKQSSIESGYPSSLTLSSVFGKLSCGKKYRAKLTMFNDCTSAESFRDISYNCTPKMDYKDIVVCNPLLKSIQICAPKTSCSTCTYTWSPASSFVNPNVATPTFNIKGKGKFTVTVTVKTADGCSNSQLVNIYVFDPADITAYQDGGVKSCVQDKDFDCTKSPYFCKLKITAKFPAYMYFLLAGSGTFTNTDCKTSYSGSSSSSTTTSAEIPKSMGGNFKFEIDLNISNYCVIGGCGKITKYFYTANDTYYWKHLNISTQTTNCTQFIPAKYCDGPASICIFVPNIINPYSSDPDISRLVFFAPLAYTGAASVNNGYGALYYKLEIFDRWGDLVCLKEGYDGTTGATGWNSKDPKSIFWDTRSCPGVENQKVQCDVYVWKLKLVNCLESRTFSSDVTVFCK